MSLTGVTKSRKGNPGEPLKSRSGYPYRPATILPADLDITKQWHIVFYLWDLGTQQLERKRVLKDKLSAIVNKEERIAFAEKMIEEINYYLERDMHLDTEPKPTVVEVNFRGYSVVEGIQYAKNYKVDYEGIKPGTAEDYDTSVTLWKEFCKFKGYNVNFRLRDVNHTVVQQFFEWLKSERKNSNKSHNNRRANLHAVVEVLMKKDRKLFGGNNPFGEVPMLKTETRKHAAYSDDQVKAVLDYCRSIGEHHLVLFIQFMYYTLARPDEICELKVGHIKLAIRRILFLAETSKTAIEEYVGISDRFARIIEESGILSYPPSHYIFSNTNRYYVGHGEARREISKEEYDTLAMRGDKRTTFYTRKKLGLEMEIDHRPGEQRVGYGYFYKRIAPIIRQLKFRDVNPNHDLYSFKHTGAISLYRATKDIKLLQRQMRHTSVEMTENYLRDLGVFEDFDLLNKWEGPA